MLSHQRCLVSNVVSTPKLSSLQNRLKFPSYQDSTIVSSPQELGLQHYFQSPAARSARVQPNLQSPATKYLCVISNPQLLIIQHCPQSPVAYFPLSSPVSSQVFSADPGPQQLGLQRRLPIPVTRSQVPFQLLSLQHHL